MQHPDIFRLSQQSSFRRRTYTSPYGHVFHILGYEDLYLDELYAEHGNIEVFAGEDMRIPVINYWMTDDDTPRRYFPDIYVPSLNMVIEVKSEYYFEKEKDIVRTKAVYASKQYAFRIVIYHNRKSKRKLYIGDASGLMNL